MPDYKYRIIHADSLEETQKIINRKDNKDWEYVEVVRGFCRGEHAYCAWIILRKEVT
jgi:hypothetical protein